MNFRPEMVAAIRRGKVATRRVVSDNPNSPWYRGGCQYHMTRPSFDRFEKTYAICPGRGKAAVGRLRLTREPELSVVENITETGARQEGFKSRQDFLNYFFALNSGVTLRTEVWVVYFTAVIWHDALLLEMLEELRRSKEAA